MVPTTITDMLEFGCGKMELSCFLQNRAKKGNADL
jgi:hypothetical protein